MSRILLSATLLAIFALSAQAGVEMAPAPNVDPKEMKVSADPRSDAGFYVAALGGAQFATDYGNNRETLDNGIFGGSSEVKTEMHSDWGAVGGLKAGYKFDSFAVCERMSLRLQPAVEAEALYIGNNSHIADMAGPGTTEHFTTNSGDFFINGILRFKNASIVTPYIGAGVGLQYITTHGSADFQPGTVNEATGLNTSDLDFAGQALFGIDVALCQHVTVFTEYKFIDAIGTDGHSTSVPLTIGGGTFRFKPDQIQQNLITAGVKYEF